MMRKYLPQLVLLSFYVFLVFISSNLHAENNFNHELKIGIYNNPPKLFIDKHGKPQGIFVDIIEEIATNEEISLKYVYGEWFTLLDKLQKGDIDILLDIAHSSNRDSIVAYNSIPVLGSWIEVFTLNNKQMSSVLDLRNKRIGVLKGSVQEDFLLTKFKTSFFENIEIYSLPSYSEMMNSLIAGEVDCVIASRFFYFNKDFRSKILPTGIVFEPGDLYFGFPKKANQDLIEMIDRNLVKMKNNPNSVFYKTLQKWLGNEYSRVIPVYIQWIIAFVLVMLLLVSSFAILLKYSVNLKTKELKIKNLELEDEKRKACENENRLRIIADNLPNGMIYQFTVNADGERKFTYVSQTATKFYGASPNEIINDASLIFGKTHPSDLNEMLVKEMLSRESLTTFQSVVRNNNPDGTVRWSYLISKPRNIDGQVFWDGLELDITDQKVIEEELVKAKDRAEESDRLKTVFLQNMSHEIRTPMNGILGFLELLSDPDLDSESRHQYIEIVNMSGQRLLTTINNIIEISKIETTQIQPKISKFNLHDVMKFYYDFFKNQAVELGLDYRMKEEMIDNKAVIWSDKEMIDHILVNLLNNAFKFTKEGFIEFGNYEESERLIIYVKDSGIGMPQDRLEAIFDRFVQADLNITRPHEGSGLGLSIVKAYVELLHGEIWVESEKGVGSTFFVSIPINHQSKALGNQSKMNENQSGEINELVSVLIVEDDYDNYFYIKSVLKGRNFKLFYAINGTEAIKILDENSDIKLILMDIKLPGMNGFELSKLISEKMPHVIIIAQTAYALEGDRAKSLECGCDDYLAKPFSASELNNIIDKYMID